MRFLRSEDKIISSIPASLKAAISAGIGLFICFIGLLNADIVKLIGDTVVDGVVVATDYSDMGAITTNGPLLALIGLLITGILMAWKVKGALFLGIVATTIIGIPMGLTTMPTRHRREEHLHCSDTVSSSTSAACSPTAVLPVLTAIVTFSIVRLLRYRRYTHRHRQQCRHAG